MVSIHKMTIKQISDLVSSEGLTPQIETALQSDERTGVRKIWQAHKRTEDKRKDLESKWMAMCEYEFKLWKDGSILVAGVDEVGRGPLAGPVVAASVILPVDCYLPGLNDSKKLSAQQRAELYDLIVEQAVCYHVAFADVHVIEQINIYQATIQVMNEAVKGLSVSPEICLIDGTRVPGMDIPQIPLVGGDGLSISIAAASVIAKVTRDQWMQEKAQQYPVYGFDRNAGYGTPDHLAAIAEHGPCPLHRKSFRGVKEWI
jgi:ribonuclease HII